MTARVCVKHVPHMTIIGTRNRKRMASQKCLFRSKKESPLRQQRVSAMLNTMKGIVYENQCYTFKKTM